MDFSITIILTIIILMISLGCSVIYYGLNKQHYLRNRTFMRKIYYFIVLVFTFYLIFNGMFPFTKTTEIISFTIGVILIDLMLIQTPDITKFLSHELKQEEYTEQIEKNEGNFQLLTEKIIKFHDIMLNHTEEVITTEEFVFSHDSYESIMKQYLKNYTEEFNINLYSYYVASSSNESIFKDNLKEQYLLIKKNQKLSTRIIGLRNEDAIEKLFSGENARDIEILHDGQTTVIFPYFGEYYNFILVITTINGVPLSGADAALLLSMMYRFDSWLKNNYVLTSVEEV